MNQEKRSGFIVSIVLVLMIIVFIALALHTHIDTSVSMSGGVNTDNTDDGPSKSETRDLAPFTAVESDGAFDIVWTGNQQQSVTVEATEL